MKPLVLAVIVSGIIFFGFIIGYSYDIAIPSVLFTIIALTFSATAGFLLIQYLLKKKAESNTKIGMKEALKFVRTELPEILGAQLGTFSMEDVSASKCMCSSKAETDSKHKSIYWFKIKRATVEREEVFSHIIVQEQERGFDFIHIKEIGEDEDLEKIIKDHYVKPPVHLILKHKKKLAKGIPEGLQQQQDRYSYEEETRERED